MLSLRRLVAAGPQKLSSRSLRILYLTLVVKLSLLHTMPTRQAILSHLRLFHTKSRDRRPRKWPLTTQSLMSLRHSSSSYIAISRLLLAPSLVSAIATIPANTIAYFGSSISSCLNTVLYSSHLSVELDFAISLPLVS
jgi:hypothetical protein